MRYKLYDKVMAINSGQIKPNKKYKGHIGEIVGIDSSNKWPYMVQFGPEMNNTLNYFKEESLVLIESFQSQFLVKVV